MGERALLARTDSDGCSSLAVSQWGGSESAIDAVCTGTPPTALPDCSWRQRARVREFQTVVARLDYLGTAAVYRVPNQHPVESPATVFLPLWFGLPFATVTANPRVGGLVAVDSLADVRALRRWFRRLKGRLADAITTGSLPIPAATAVLCLAIVSLRHRERYVTVAPGTAERFSPETGPDGP